MHGESLQRSANNPLTWITLKSSIETLPDLTTWLEISSNDISARQKEDISRRRSFFRKLLEKVVGNDKDQQVEFLIQEARKINKKTYVQAALRSIPMPPDYSSLDKIHRPRHSHVHKLIDLILPLAAGSETATSQKLIFKSRWQYLHNQSFTASEIQDMINEVTNPVDL